MNCSEHVATGPIGVFDSGYGGLTILKSIREQLPEFDYLYLGDNARAPYGSRSFDVVYQFTLEAVNYLFDQGCPLVILACNTASAKALRTIQQHDLPAIDPTRRVLGVIRPTVEALGNGDARRTVGVLGTPGTIASGSYEIEIAKLHPGFTTVTQECPLWAALVECDEAAGDGADYFVDKDINLLFGKNPDIDTVVLACTHYPLLLPKIERAVAGRASILTQGDIVARSLADYLRRHPDMEARCSRGGSATYLTTERPDKFTHLAEIFLSDTVDTTRVSLTSPNCVT